MQITIELKKEVDLGWANGWGHLQDALSEALYKKAQEMGVKCEVTKLRGRCYTKYRYPGVFSYCVDSSD